MIGRDAIAALVPHAGAMVLLDAVEGWHAEAIACRATSHLDPANTLRRAGRLSAVAGVEYGLQAAAVHGALTAPGGPARGAAGYLAALREVALVAERLDDPALGRLRVSARLERREARGVAYAFAVAAEDARPLVSGRAVIAFPGEAP